jgi:hypothetical protein
MAEVLAIASVFISLISLAISILNFRRDAGHLNFEFLNLVIFEKDDLSSRMEVEITNKGRRSLTVRNYKVYKSEKRFIIFSKKTHLNTVELTKEDYDFNSSPQKLKKSPLKLEEGQNHTETIWNIKNIDLLAINETKGKSYKFNVNKIMEKLKKSDNYKYIS